MKVNQNQKPKSSLMQLPWFYKYSLRWVTAVSLEFIEIPIQYRYSQEISYNSDPQSVIETYIRILVR